MSAIEQVLIEKIRQLPLERMVEVDDFMDFLRARDEQRLTHAATRISEASFAQLRQIQPKQRHRGFRIPPIM